MEYPPVRILPLTVTKKEYGRKKVVTNAIGKKITIQHLNISILEKAAEKLFVLLHLC